MRLTVSRSAPGILYSVQLNILLFHRNPSLPSLFILGHFATQTPEQFGGWEQVMLDSIDNIDVISSIWTYIINTFQQSKYLHVVNQLEFEQFSFWEKESAVLLTWTQVKSCKSGISSSFKLHVENLTELGNSFHMPPSHFNDYLRRTHVDVHFW